MSAEFEKGLDGVVYATPHNKSLMLNELDKVGKGFCLAKWTQVTMHLGTGLTHSCHHPIAHPIDVDEIKTNPSALHNTGIKKDARKEMLNGNRPSECDFCWRIEDTTENVSDRVLKSLAPFSISDLGVISKMTGDEDVYPRYVEISFSNVCNLKCAYCGPLASSKWVEEIASSGPYKLDGGDYNWTDLFQIPKRESNPYVDAFWKWLPDALPHMHTFRITGGEPLMSKDTFRFMDYLLEHPHPDLDFSINSNAVVPDKLWALFIDKVNALLSAGAIREFTLYVSAESVGSPAEYARHGMDWNRFTSNVAQYLENTNDTRVTFMSAFNVLSITTFTDFLKYVLSLKRQYNGSGTYTWLENSGIDTGWLRNDNVGMAGNIPCSDRSKIRSNRIGIDIPYIRYPNFLDANILPLELVQKYIIPSVDFMYANVGNSEWNGSLGFDTNECEKLRRILMGLLHDLNYNKGDVPDHIEANRGRFYQFITEYDKRRHVDFSSTFSELVDFLTTCENVADARIISI